MKNLNKELFDLVEIEKDLNEIHQKYVPEMNQIFMIHENVINNNVESFVENICKKLNAIFCVHEADILSISFDKTINNVVWIPLKRELKANPRESLDGNLDCTIGFFDDTESEDWEQNRNTKFLNLYTNEPNYAIIFSFNINVICQIISENKIPVLISQNNFILPFENSLDWKKIMLFFDNENMNYYLFEKEILAFHQENNHRDMLNNAMQLLNEYFNKNAQENIQREIYNTFRVHYYTSHLTKKWQLTFFPDTEEVQYQEDDCIKTYKEEVNPYCYFLICIHEKFCFEEQKQRFWNKFKNTKRTYPQWANENIWKGVWDQEKEAYIDYCIEYQKYFKNVNFILRPGDVTYNTKIPIITKTRPCQRDETSQNVILNLDKTRHWNKPIKQVQDNDIMFDQKNDKIIWRGEPNGFMNTKFRACRRKLCTMFSEHENKNIDIGFVRDYENIKGRGFLSIKEQLQSKFIVSIEGGDVATNLKWILYSNSVCLMPKPIMSGWYMEDVLQEWVHYIPIALDFSDLEEKYKWCLENQDKCKEISENAREFILPFFDKEQEENITRNILKKYYNFVKIKF